MRILLVSNTAQRCGVAQMGRRMFRALTEGAGVDGYPPVPGMHISEGWDRLKVAKWTDKSYLDNAIAWWPADHPHDLPEVGDQFDIVHLNYHPGTLGHIRPRKVEGALLSVYFHEPGSGQEWWDLADLRITSEEREGARYLPVPVPDYHPKPRVGHVPDGVWIGHSSIRQDGIDWVTPAIRKHPDWGLSLSSAKWLSDQEEIERLAACDLTIFHPHSGNPGQSSAVVMGIAARRPLLINSSPMLRTLWDSEEVYRYEDPEEGILKILGDLREGKARYPLGLAQERSWSRAAERLQGWWKEIL